MAIEPKTIKTADGVTIANPYTGHRRLPICTTPTVKTKRPYTAGLIDWEQFVGGLKRPTDIQLSQEDFLTMPKDEQFRIKDSAGAFVFGELEGGRRLDGCVRTRSAVCLDLDNIPAEAADPWETFTGNFHGAAVLHTTAKHTPEKRRFRVIIPLSRDVTPDEYQAVARKIMETTLGMDLADDTTYQSVRAMFYPVRFTSGEYRVEAQTGPFADPDSYLAMYPGGRWQDMVQLPLSSREQRQGSRLSAISGSGKQQDPLAKKGAVGDFCRAYTVQEAIETFIPDTYTPTSSPDRWTYTQGTSSGGLVIYDNTLAISYHATDPAGDGHEHNAFDLVRLHLYGHMDDEADPTQIGKNLPSYKAMVERAEKDERVQEVRLAERAAEMFGSQEAAAENLDWFTKLETDKHGNVLGTVDNTVIILENDPQLKGLGGLNDLARQAEISDDLPWRKRDPRNPGWTDTDDHQLLRYLEKKYGLHSAATELRARDIAHTERRFSPVKNYLDNLPAWDGVPRLDTLFIDYQNAEDNAYTRAVTRKTLTAAVARIYEPGKKFDQVLTLQGEQGNGKSTLIRTLCPDENWFSDALNSFDVKNGGEALEGVWIMEVGELAAAKKSDIDQIKGFITRQVDRYRPAYGRHTMSYPRQCVLFGTTNDDAFLRDLTGNRRWWIVETNGYEGARKPSLAQLEAERDQIWAEAKWRYRQGEPLTLPKDLEAHARMVQDEYTQRPGEFQDIENFLDQLVPDGWESWGYSRRIVWLKGYEIEGFEGDRDRPGTHTRDAISQKEIWCECFGQPLTEPLPAGKQQIYSSALKKLGWVRDKNKTTVNADYGRQKIYRKP